MFFKKQKNNNWGNEMVDFARDWKIVVWLFVIGLFSLSFLAWQIYLSNKIGGGLVTSETEIIDDSILTFDQEKLKADIVLLETKQKDFFNSKK
jgi:hypothetical protein